MAYMGINQPKPSGFPCTHYREQLMLNALSYATANFSDSDDFRTNSTISGMPARPNHLQDLTAYPVGSVRSDNWIEHVRGKRGVDTDTNNPV